VPDVAQGLLFEGLQTEQPDHWRPVMTADEKTDNQSIEEMASDIEDAADVASLVSTLLKGISKKLKKNGEGKGRAESDHEDGGMKLKMSQD